MLIDLKLDSKDRGIRTPYANGRGRDLWKDSVVYLNDNFDDWLHIKLWYFF
jgi:hypothetical protein